MLLIYKICPGLDNLLNILEQTKTIEQLEKWHPEIYVLNHSLQVFRGAKKESRDINLLLAALFHDIGKIKDSIGHDQIGADILEENKAPNEVVWVVRHHMRYWSYILGEMKKYSKCQYLLNNPKFKYLVQLGRWDKIGRNPKCSITYNRQNIIDTLENVIIET